MPMSMLFALSLSLAPADDKPPGAKFFVALPVEVVAGVGSELDVPAIVFNENIRGDIVVTAALDGGPLKPVAKIAAKSAKRAGWANAAEVTIPLTVGAGDHVVELCFAEKRRKAVHVCARLTVASDGAGSFAAKKKKGGAHELTSASVSIRRGKSKLTIGDGADAQVAESFALATGGDAHAEAPRVDVGSYEPMLNIIANGMEILGIAWGGPTMIIGWAQDWSGPGDRPVLFGAAGVTGGLATPGVINWLVASARDANLFS